MSPEAFGSLAILTLAALLFLTRLLPLEVTALGIPVSLILLGILPETEALEGFGNRTVLALGGVFVIGAGLQRSGVATLIARVILRAAGEAAWRMNLFLMIGAAILSAFMSNTATVAVLLPAVISLSRRTGTPTSRLMMPMAFGAILGGNLTLIATAPNLVVSAYLRSQTETAMGMFEFAWIGAPILAAGVLYMLVLGTRLLPSVGAEDRWREAKVPEGLLQSYQMMDNVFRLRVREHSLVRGQTLAETGIGRDFGLSVLMVVRPSGLSRRFHHPGPEFRLLSGDEVIVQGTAESAWEFSEEKVVQFGLPAPGTVDELIGRGTTLAEVALSPTSSLVGKTLREIEFRASHGLTVLLLWRRGEAVREGHADLALEFGDMFLVSGTVERIRRLSEGPDFLVVSDISTTEDAGQAPLALLLLAVAVVPPMLGLLPLPVSALLAATLFVATRCISASEAVQSVDWRVLFLIIGTLPLGTALEVHGLAQLAAEGVQGLARWFGPASVLAILFLAAAVVSVTSSNAAAAVILSPVGYRAAMVASIDPTAALLAIAYGASCTYIVPFAHPCNLMVLGPGGYRTADFLRVGGGMSLVTGATAIALLLLLYS